MGRTAEVGLERSFYVWQSDMLPYSGGAHATLMYIPAFVWLYGIALLVMELLLLVLDSIVTKRS